MSVIRRDTGFRDDCKRLIYKFASSGTLLYNDFVAEWQKMKFALIFRGRSSIYDMIDFIEDAFLVTKTFLFPPNKVDVRIGALYMLYGLYYRQPTVSSNNKYVKIRLVYDEWMSLMELINSLKANGYFDACYIFYKLLLDKAFHFVCFSYVYGIESKNLRKREKEIEKSSDLESQREAKLLLSSSILERLLNDSNFTIPWRKKEMEYNRLTKDLKQQKILDPDKFKTTDFIDDILNDISGTQITSEKSDLDTPDEVVVDNENVSRTKKGKSSERRRALKNRTKSEAKNLQEISRRPGTLASYRDKIMEEQLHKKAEESNHNQKEGEDVEELDKRDVNKRHKVRNIVSYLDDCENQAITESVGKDNDGGGSSKSTCKKNSKSLPNLMTDTFVDEQYLFGDDEEFDSDDSSEESDSTSDNDEDESNTKLGKSSKPGNKKCKTKKNLPKDIAGSMSLKGVDFLIFN